MRARACVCLREGEGGDGCDGPPPRLLARQVRGGIRENKLFFSPSPLLSALLAEEVELDVSERQEVGDRPETCHCVARLCCCSLRCYLRLAFMTLRKRRSCRCAFSVHSLLLLSHGSSWCCGEEEKKKQLKCRQKLRKVDVRAFFGCPTRSQTDAESVSREKKRGEKKLS